MHICAYDAPVPSIGLPWELTMSNARLLARTLCLCVITSVALSVHAARADSSAASATISKYDTDSDKTLDLAEVKAAASARFAALDKDGDGTLDSKELRGVFGPTTFKKADTDHDGTLSKDEYLALVDKLFEAADRDHDGTLDAKELGAKTSQTLRRLIG
jgi:Ca2+-binding EF-hand superfamily protein